MVQGNRSAGYKARTEPDSKELLGAGTTKQEGVGKSVASFSIVSNSRIRPVPILNGYTLISRGKYPDAREYLRFFWAGTRVAV